MISQHSLKPNPGSRKRSRSLGRGDSSGHGSFSGHGGKGQTARSGGNIKAGFEGGQTPLIRRLPKLKGFKNPNRLPFQTINVESLNDFEDGSTVDIVALYENRLISRKNRPVKILGNGELTKKLTVKADACSGSAKQKIEAKGGEILLPVKTPSTIKQDV